MWLCFSEGGGWGAERVGMVRQQPSRLDQCAAVHLVGLFVLGSLLILLPKTEPPPPEEPLIIPKPVYTWIPRIIPKPVPMIIPKPESPLPIKGIATVEMLGPQCFFAQNVSSMTRSAIGPTVVLGSENHLLSHLYLPAWSKLTVFEPRKERWEMSAKSVDPMQVQLHWGLFSNLHRWLQMDVTTLEIEPYDLDSRKPYQEQPELFPAGPWKGDASILLISHWRYWCYYAEQDRNSVEHFKSIIVLNPEGHSCQHSWVQCNWLR
jgi:hypothetical protein